jgi:hypothetical protein
MRISDAALLLALSAPAFQARPPESTAHRQSAALIREVLLSADARRSEPIDPEIARLAVAGTAVIPGLFDVLATGALPGSLDDPPVSLRQEDVAVGALARFRRGDLGRRIDPLLAPAARPEARRAGFRLLGLVGERTDLALLCDALRGPDPEADPDREEARQFQVAVAAILVRDELSFSMVRGMLHGGAPALRFHLVGALARTGSPAALGILSAELSSRLEETAYILSESAKLAGTVPLPVDEAVAASFRLHLHSDDPMIVRASAECLGRCQDVDSAYDLIELLGHPNPDTARAVLEALRAITGTGLLADKERWRSWLLAQAEWHSEVFPRLAEVFGGTNSLEKMAAVQELAGHALYRADIARLFERALPGETAPLLAAACSALRQIEAGLAVPFLEQCALHASPEVAAEARSALEALRARRPGKPHPGDPQGMGAPDR